ncbi:MAG: aminotransferase class I and II [Bacteroidetes bacterium]|nr:aminotransferase class I and II [Bacteroidota bacterium]MBS1630459.1 aminotransferase class I and II [Bacteroidota bacterium]
MLPSELRRVSVIRYVTPLREGGSLPAIAEADDGFLYVLKFRGAGQGPNALIADLLGAELARALGLNVPELVFADLDEAFGRSEPDEEIQDLLKASTGLNLGLHYLQGAVTYDSNLKAIEPKEASKIVWLDALIMNVDRSFRNTNLLLWKDALWLIDHGASFYFHNDWASWETRAVNPFVLIKDHVLLAQASVLDQANEECRVLLSPEQVQSIVALIPEDWLGNEPYFPDVCSHRQAYAQFLNERIAQASIFVNAAQDARKGLV